MSEESALMVARRAADRIEAHEKLCEALSRNTNEAIHDMKTTMSTFSKIGVGLLVAISGWALVELYGHIDQAAHAASTVTVMRTAR